MQQPAVHNDDDPPLGPIDYLVVEFPGSRFNGEIMPELIDLVDRGVIRILDMLVVRKTSDGDVVAAELSDLPTDELAEGGLLDWALSGLLADDDVVVVGEQLAAGATAGIVVWENLWAAPLGAAVTKSGGGVIAAGRVDIASIHESLMAADRLAADTQGADL